MITVMMIKMILVLTIRRNDNELFIVITMGAILMR